MPGHDAILHEDFICITPAGARVSRADYLKAWATGFDPDRIPYFDYRDEKIDVFGDTALVRSTNRSVRMVDGAPVGLSIIGGRGTDATVTDANLILSYIPADYFLGGEMSLDAKAAKRASAAARSSTATPSSSCTTPARKSADSASPKNTNACTRHPTISCIAPICKH